jgi:hypothetical protein
MGPRLLNATKYKPAESAAGLATALHLLLWGEGGRSNRFMMTSASGRKYI